MLLSWDCIQGATGCCSMHGEQSGLSLPVRRVGRLDVVWVLGFQELCCC